MDDPRALFERVEVQIAPPADRMEHLPCKLCVYRGAAWASMAIGVEDMEDLLVDREFLFSYFERELGYKLSEYI